LPRHRRDAFLVSVAKAVLPHGIAQVTRYGITPSFIGVAEQFGVDVVGVDRVPSPMKSPLHGRARFVT
jgi:hypothetical protein